MAVLANAKHEIFAQELAQGRSQLEAYRTAGYRGDETHACRLASNDKVRARVAELQKAGAEKAELSVAGVLMKLWQIATADPRELIEYRIGCCRYCWGKGFRYQETIREREARFREWERAERDAQEQDEPPEPTEFSELGGVGYNATRPPNPDCPECFGEGQGRPVLKDTSRLSADAAELYAGVKVTNSGIEVKTHDKVGALTKVGQHLGMFVERKINTEVGLEDFLAQLDAGTAPGAGETGPAEA